MFGRTQPGTGSKALRKAPQGGEVVNPCCGGGCKNDGPPREDEGPSEADIAQFSGVTRDCPACGKEVHDDAAICYHCGEAFEKTTAGSGDGPPAWVLVTAAVVVLGVVVAALFGRRLF